MRLHEALDPGSEGLALLLYQFSTLQFILGRLGEARALCERSAALSDKVFKPGSDQVSTLSRLLGCRWGSEQKKTRWPCLCFFFHADGEGGQ